VSTKEIGSDTFVRRKASSECKLPLRLGNHLTMNPAYTLNSEHWGCQCLVKAQRRRSGNRVISLLYKNVEKWQFPIYLICLIFLIHPIARQLLRMVSLVCDRFNPKIRRKPMTFRESFNDINVIVNVGSVIVGRGEPNCGKGFQML